MNDEDLKLFCENLDDEKTALGKKIEDYRRGIVNQSDLQDALKMSLRFLETKNELLRSEKRRLETFMSVDSGDVFKCVNDAVNRYDAAYEIAYYASRHSIWEKISLCCRKICECCAILCQTANFINGCRFYKESKDDFIKLKDMIHSERLLNGLTIQLTELLFWQVEEFWSRLSYEEGKIIVQICRQRVSDLLRQDSDVTRRETLESRLKKLDRIAEQSETFVTGSRDIIARELMAVRELAKNGFLALTEHLTNDLDQALTACRTFLEQFESYQAILEDNLSLVSVDELKRLISEAGWDLAACRFLETILRNYGEKLKSLNNNLLLAEKIGSEAASGRTSKRNK